MSLSKKERTRQFNNLVKSIRRSNTNFQKADQAGKIVMVAKDVLAMLKLHRITAKSGVYVCLPDIPDSKEATLDLTQPISVQKVLQIPELPACNVCAIGAGMIASTLRLNRVYVAKEQLSSYKGSLEYTSNPRWSFERLWQTSNQMSGRVQEVFSDSLLRYMENAFEEGIFNYSQLSSPTTRLRAIYQNLVDNQGKRFTYYKSDEIVYKI